MLGPVQLDLINRLAARTDATVQVPTQLIRDILGEITRLQSYIDKSKLCLHPRCQNRLVQAVTRGLCKNHYDYAKRQIKARQRTEAQLIQDGKLLPAKSHDDRVYDYDESDCDWFHRPPDGFDERESALLNMLDQNISLLKQSVPKLHVERKQE